ncbi:MAG: PfkB family carbohydrate kinase [Planctomycetota bacterium]|nr:PfkB family carbohydrate kinase [Planctomycetota bacterium]
MPVLVVGSVGIDDIETPAGARKGLLGGSAVYFSLAASLYTRALLVANVGTDFPAEFRDALATKDIDLSGLAVEDGETFRWSGRYRENMNDRDTLETRLNVFGSFDPILPEAFRSCPYVFLANGVPAVQLRTLAQMRVRPKLVAADTMDLWIRTTASDLAEVISKVNVLTVNDSEARMLSGRRSLPDAAAAILSRGPKVVIVKKGEHGVTAVGRDIGLFSMPAYPTGSVVDPTGAGDSFAGAMMGYLAGTDEVSPDNVRRAIAHGTVAASFTVESFGVERLASISRRDVEERLRELREIVRIPA